MAIKRCLKCGADIPDGAEFCPSCGAPKGAKAVTQQQQQPVQPQQPVYQQQPMSAAAPLSMQKESPLAGIFDMVFSKTGIILAITLGVLLAWIGVVMFAFSDTGDNWDFAIMLNSMGFAAVGLFACAGGIWNKRIDKYARTGMVLIGGFVIVMGLSMLSGLLNFG